MKNILFFNFCGILLIVVCVVTFCTSRASAQFAHMCLCTANYNPVCGSDGRLYSNKCHFLCSKSDNPRLTLKKRGFCKGMSSLIS